MRRMNDRSKPDLWTFDGESASAAASLTLTATAGCSSLLPIDRTSKRLGFCRMTAETREVPTITLEMLLGWLNRPVEFIKVDAQGLDLAVVQSAHSRMSQVQSFQLEIVSDDCDSIYKGQPKCSEVLPIVAGLGFKPARPRALASPLCFVL